MTMPHAILRPKPASLAAILVAAVLSSTACDPGSTAVTDFMAEAQFSYTVDVVDQVRLRLDAINGTIRVTGVVDATTMTVEGTKLVWSNSQADADAALDNLAVVIDEGVEVFHVHTDQPEQDGRAYAVEYEIRLPDDLEVAMVNVNGDIIVEFVKNSVEITSVNAAINLDEIEGNVSIQLVNGDVDAELTLPLDGVVDMAVADGDITLEIPTDTSAEIYFEIACCGNNFSNLDVQDLEHSPPGVWPPTVTGTLGAGQGTISLAVGNGIITMIGT
jgi:hypothetical protein